MAWYAYCITEQATFQQGRVRRPFPIEELKGIHNAPVWGYPSGEFVVVVSQFPANPELSQQAILDHARVITDCFRMATVLPFRFGTIFETDEALRQAVRVNRKTFSESVEKLRGKAEMHLKVTVQEGATIPQVLLDALPARAGGEYLAKLREKASRDRERQSKARALSVQVHKLFDPLEEDVVCKKVDSGLVIDIAHLIDTATISKYQNRYSTATKQLKDCRVSLSGPWPPYHFMKGKLRTVNNSN